MPQAYIKDYNGYPALFVDGKPFPPMMATIYSRKDDEVIMKEEYYKNLGESGVKVFFLICDTEWLAPGSFELFKQQAEMVLKAVPDAYFFLRIGMHPPIKWIEEHPEECVTFADGSHLPVKLWTETYKADQPAMYSLCSKKWREDASSALLETYDQLEKLPYFDRIIGFFFAAGGTSEWYYLGARKQGTYGDFSEAFRKNFEEYLRETYNNDVNALRKAWGDDTATFENPHIPDEKERAFITAVDESIKFPVNCEPCDPLSEPPRSENYVGVFTNLDKTTNVFDYFRAWNIGTAKTINHFAEVIKKRSGGEKLTGAFYGSQGCTNYFYSSSASAALTVLNGGKIDFLAAPSVYQNRQIGGFAGQREPIDSFRLRNMMYVVEEDTRTHHENAYFGDLYETFTLEDTLTIMKRDFGRDLCEDIQAWWFDQHKGGGRYDEKEVFELISRQQEVAKEAYEKPRTKKNEIAFIYDEESLNFASEKTCFEAVELFRDYELSLIGASADMYYHNDMAKPDMPSYKLYIFFNVYYINDEERKAIKEKLKKDGAVAVWVYAAGYANPDAEKKMDIANITDLTGFEVGIKDYVVSPKFKINGEEHEITKRLDKGQIYGYNYRYKQNNMFYSGFDNTQLLYPAFYSTDKNAKDLAYFLQEKIPAVSIKEMDGWTSLFYGARNMRNDIVRELARFAGCHIFCESDDIIYASRNYVTIHAASTGEKTLYFPENCTPFEIYEQKAYGEKVNKITFNLLKGETKTFELK